MWVVLRVVTRIDTKSESWPGLPGQVPARRFFSRRLSFVDQPLASIATRALQHFNAKARLGLFRGDHPRSRHGDTARVPGPSPSSGGDIMEYKLITGDSVCEMESKVNSFLREGWVCQGGIAIRCYEGTPCVTYVQAIVRSSPPS